MQPLSPPIVRLILFSALITFAGCSGRRMNREPAPSAVRGNSAPLRPLAIPDTKPPSPRRTPSLEDPNLQAPPPPELTAQNRTKADQAVPAAVIAEPSLDLVKASPPRLDADQLEVPGAQTRDPLADLRRILKAAESRCASIECFEARLSRREFLDGSQKPLEVIRFQFRKKPLSVHMKWIGSEGQGRELVFVDGRHEGKIHILTARGDIFPLSPVTRLGLDPDSDMVRSKSRHSIRDAGMTSSVRQLGRLLTAAEKAPGRADRVTYRGLVQRSEYRTKLEAVEMVIAPGEEHLLPRGGRRTSFFDPTPESPSQSLPVVVSTRDHTGREVEYYCFDRFLFPIVLDDADFNPDRLFGRR